MKLRKAKLHHGIETPVNEPDLTSANYDLEVVPTNVGGMLKVKPKTQASGPFEFYVPLASVSYIIVDTPPADPKAQAQKK